MGIISWIILGFLAGAIAKALVPGRDPAGCIITIVLGILGAFVGGWIGTVLGLGTVEEFNIGSLALSILGAAVVLLIYRAIARRP